jgi:hypothetical protein
MNFLIVLALRSVSFLAAAWEDCVSLFAFLRVAALLSSFGGGVGGRGDTGVFASRDDERGGRGLAVLEGGAGGGADGSSGVARTGAAGKDISWRSRSRIDKSADSRIENRAISEAGWGVSKPARRSGKVGSFAVATGALAGSKVCSGSFGVRGFELSAVYCVGGALGCSNVVVLMFEIDADGLKGSGAVVCGTIDGDFFDGSAISNTVGFDRIADVCEAGDSGLFDDSVF